MARVLCFLFSLLTSTLRSRLSLQLEIAALRHQLSTYRLQGQQPRIVALWQKKRFRYYWRALSQGGRPGRPKIAPELRQLIKRMWRSNPTWGSPRIVAELHKLGIEVTKSTVEKYKPQGERLPSVTWRTFLDLHLKDLVPGL
jgi:hypothetical protein